MVLDAVEARLEPASASHDSSTNLAGVVMTSEPASNKLRQVPRSEDQDVLPTRVTNEAIVKSRAPPFRCRIVPEGIDDEDTGHFIDSQIELRPSICQLINVCEADTARSPPLIRRSRSAPCWQ
jgi:hypothetical protein